MLRVRWNLSSVWTWLGVWSVGYEIQFQTWGLQARMALPSMLVHNHNPYVYNWMLILNVKFVLFAKPGIQSQTWYSMHDGIHKFILVIFSPNVGWHSTSSLVSGIQCNVNSTGIQGTIWDWITIVKVQRSIYDGNHKYVWHSFQSLAFNVKSGIQRSKNKKYTNLPWKFTANTKLVIQNEHWDWIPGLRLNTKHAC